MGAELTAYILARAGSRRIPNKHTRRFCNAPMIHHAIWRAARCPGVDRIVVSTNDPALVDCVQEQSVWCEIHDRSPESAAPETPMWQALLEAATARGDGDAMVAMVYATAAFLRPKWVDEAVAMLDGGMVDSACAVYQDGSPIERALVRDGDGRISSRFPEHDNHNNLGWPTTYHHASQFFVVRVPQMQEAQTLMIPGRTGGVVVPRHQVEDVDEPDDWAVAEAKLRLLEVVG